MPGSRAFLRRRHVTAAAAGEGPHRCHRGPASACSRGTPAEGRAARGELGATERYRVAGRRSGADGIEPPAKSFGACPVRADAAAAPVPSTSAQPVPVAGPDDRSDDGHPNAQLARSPAAVPCPAGTERRRELISELGTRAAELVQHAGADQERPAAVTAATAKTPLQVTCSRRSPGPAAFTAKTPKNGLEITAGLRAGSHPGPATLRDR